MIFAYKNIFAFLIDYVLWKASSYKYQLPTVLIYSRANNRKPVRIETSIETGVETCSRNETVSLSQRFRPRTVKFHPRNNAVLVNCWCMLIIDVSYFIPKTLVQSPVLYVFGVKIAQSFSLTNQILHSPLQDLYSYRFLRFRLLDCMEWDRMIKSFYFEVSFCINVVFVAYLSRKSISSPVLKEDLTCFIWGGAVLV